MTHVKAGFFSLTPPAPPDDDGSYLRWHLLDHMPEQYRIPGIALGSRWIADGDYPDHRIEARGPLSQVGGLVTYLMADPVQATYEDFMALGGALRDAGRFPVARPSLQARLLQLAATHAARAATVTADVVPFRPNRGVILVVEEPVDDKTAWHDWLAVEHDPSLLDAPGVAGIWSFHSTDNWALLPATEGPPQRITLIYLDADPLATTATIRPLIEQRWARTSVRPVFAGPLRTMMRWDAWPEG